MKYIRTKNGKIIDTTKYYIENSNLFKGGAYQEYKKELANAYKQADTIEELIDEFVIKTDHEYLHAQYYYVDKTFYIYNTDEEISLEECLRFNYIVYGAIWTDKGLIYVAKIKSSLPKGKIDWELL